VTATTIVGLKLKSSKVEIARRNGFVQSAKNVCIRHAMAFRGTTERQPVHHSMAQYVVQLSKLILTRNQCITARYNICFAWLLVLKPKATHSMTACNNIWYSFQVEASQYITACHIIRLGFQSRNGKPTSERHDATTSGMAFKVEIESQPVHDNMPLLGTKT
jgi:hypothetical protein